jgi:hypothetical protein
MKALRANSYQADRGLRFARAWAIPPSSRANDRAPAAEVATLPASAAFLHSTESVGCSLAPESAPAGSVSDEIPATNPVAKASEDNGATVQAMDEVPADSVTGEASRPHGADHAGGTPLPIRRDSPERRVLLSEASIFILSLIAAHEGRPASDVLALLIAGAAEAIGLHPLIMRGASDFDLVSVPDYARNAANRFRGGGP